MENTTSESGKPVGNPTGKRVARCLTCGNEWLPRDGATEKPSRCPECKKRNVKWRDLCTPEELILRKDDVGKVEEPPEEPLENTTENNPVDPETVENHGKEAVEKTKKPAKSKSSVENESVLGVAPASRFSSVEKPDTGIVGKIPVVPLVLIIGVLGAIGGAVFLFRKTRKKIKNTQLLEADAKAAARAKLEIDRARALETFAQRGL